MTVSSPTNIDLEDNRSHVSTMDDCKSMDSLMEDNYMSGVLEAGPKLLIFQEIKRFTKFTQLKAASFWNFSGEPFV